jgi:hypothetical protein
MDAPITETQVAWQGPSAFGEQLTIVGSAKAWEAIRAAWYEPVRDRIDPKVEFDRDVVVIAAGPQSGELNFVLSVGRLTRSGDQVSLDVKVDLVNTQAAQPSAMNNPTLVFTAPRTVFDGDPSITATFYQRPWSPPVHYAR